MIKIEIHRYSYIRNVRRKKFLLILEIDYKGTEFLPQTLTF